MATEIYIHYYTSLAKDSAGRDMPIPEGYRGQDKVAVGGASAQSGVLPSYVKFVELVSDTACQWEQGSNPTAGAGSRFLPANVLAVYPVKAGERIAVIQQQ